MTPEKDKVDWDNLQDNRDLQVIMSWDPHLRLVNKVELYDGTSNLFYNKAQFDVCLL